MILEDDLIAADRLRPHPRPVGARSWTQRLRHAVLEAALGDLSGLRDVVTTLESRMFERRGLRASWRYRRRQLAQLDAWFRADDATWPFSFQSICEALALDPGAVRAVVLAPSWRASAGVAAFQIRDLAPLPDDDEGGLAWVG